ESVKSLGTDAFFTQVIRDGMSRAPVLEFDSIKDCYDCFQWVRQNESFEKMKLHFDQTSRYANLQRVDPRIEGNYLFLRFVATTGDAMGMNMVTRGTGKAIECLRLAFPQARLLSISGNLCVDKKASALNWIEGRGKSVVAEAFIPAQI
uniref:3-hydroxy-3-methylglutaryl-coenzyme A reductase n=1 Tax=Meloidogyne javanica TaxID=6303 RepID=A0A915M3A1_MELJA